MMNPLYQHKNVNIILLYFHSHKKKTSKNFPLNIQVFLNMKDHIITFIEICQLILSFIGTKYISKLYIYIYIYIYIYTRIIK